MVVITRFNAPYAFVQLDLGDKASPESGKKWTILSTNLVHITGTQSLLSYYVLPEYGFPIQIVAAGAASENYPNASVFITAAGVHVATPIQLPLTIKSTGFIMLEGGDASAVAQIIVLEEDDMPIKSAPKTPPRMGGWQ